MRFDASPETQRLVYKTVAVDPRMIRTGMVRIGTTLSEISKVGGRADWISQEKRSREDTEEFMREANERSGRGSMAP